MGKMKCSIAIVLRGIFSLVVATSCISLAFPAEGTSVDIYCDTMVFSLMQTHERLNKSKYSESQKRKAAEIEAGILEFCKSSPAEGGEKLQSKMTPLEMNVVSCMGFVDGVFQAYYPDYVEYSKLKERRMFVAKACASNSKAVKNDIYKYGPDYVLEQKY